MLFVALLVAAQAGLSLAGCNADNCARAVTGTNALPALSIRQADCSSFQLTTVTPSAVTVTNTVTITPAPPVKRDNEKRQVTVVPTAVPTYASACSGTVRYASACSCWGITAHTTFAPTPTSTVTATVTAVPTACSNPGSCGTFFIISDPSCGDFGVCTCAEDSDGSAKCVQDASCGNQACTSDSDCSAGPQGQAGVCWTNNCCGSNICTFASTICANPQARSRLFRLKAKRGSDVPTAAFPPVAKRGDCSGTSC